MQARRGKQREIIAALGLSRGHSGTVYISYVDPFRYQAAPPLAPDHSRSLHSSQTRRPFPMALVLCMRGRWNELGIEASLCASRRRDCRSSLEARLES